MKKLSVSLLFLSMLIGCGSPPNEATIELYESGLELLDQYDVDGARATFAKIGDIDPGSPYILYTRGLVLERQLSLYDALHEYMSALATDDEFALAAEATFRVFTQLEVYESAVEAAMTFENIRPQDPHAKLVMAEALMNIGRHLRARHLVTEAVNLGLSPAVGDLVRARAFALAHVGDSADLLRNGALSRPEQSAEFMSQAVKLYEAIGRPDSAIVFSRQAVRLSGDNPRYVLEHFRRALEHNYFYEARLAMAKVPAEHGSEVTSLGLNQAYYEAVGDNGRARKTAAFFRQRSHGSISSVLLDILTAGVHSDILANSMEINSIYKRMEDESYLPAFQKYMHLVLAMSQSYEAPERETLKQLDAVPGIWSSRKEVRLKTARLSYKIGMFEEAAAAMELIEKTHAAQPDWLTGLADLYCEPLIGDYDEAERLYRKALSADSFYVPAFKNMVAMFRRLYRPEDAVKVFDRYPHLPAALPFLGTVKAVVLAEAGRAQAALSEFEKAIGYVKGDLCRFEDILATLEKRGRVEEMARLVDLLENLGNDNPDALVLLARLAGDRHQFDLAANFAGRALDIEPDHRTAPVQKARALYWQGQKSQALEAFKAIHRVDRLNVENNYYYSRILAEDESRAGKASNLAREALFNSGGVLRIWMNLCYVYYCEGRYDLSRGEASKASEVYPHEPEPFFRLGMAMYREGKPEAREKLEMAIELGLWGDYLRTARETLAKL